MFTKSRAAFGTVACTGLVVGTALWATAASAAARASDDAHPWVGNAELSHVAGQVRPDALLGVNFGVDLASSADPSTMADIRLTLDLTQAAGKVVVTGLTEGCDPTPTMITCQVSPADAATHFQSMTLIAADGAPTGATCTITATTESADENGTQIDREVATIDLAVVVPEQPAAPPTARPAEPAATRPAGQVAPPDVIAPLPSMTAPALLTSVEMPVPGVTLTATMAEVPDVIRTRSPGFSETGAETKQAHRREAAPDGASVSPALTIALGASSAGLLALFIWGVVTAYRANRPTRRLSSDDPTRPIYPIRRR